MPDPATRSIVVERVMPHPPEKVWRALTEGPLIEQWLMKNDFQPVVGHRFHFRADPTPHWNGVTDCEVLAVEPHRRLSYRWCSSGEEAADGLDTVVTWTLSPADGGTRLVYTAHATVGGKLAQVGSRLIDGVARKMADDFFAKFNQALAPAPQAASVHVGELADTDVPRRALASRACELGR